MLGLVHCLPRVRCLDLATKQEVCAQISGTLFPPNAIFVILLNVMALMSFVGNKNVLLQFC